MKKNYNNKNYSKTFNSSEGYHKKRKGENDKKHYKEKFESARSENTETFSKNPHGFLIVSLFIPKQTSFLVASDTIDSILLSSQIKKKIVISMEDAKDKSLLSSLKKKFENTFGIFFFNPKSKLVKNSTKDSSIIHTEVLKTFKSNFFLTITAGVSMSEFALEKMILFLCKPNDTIAVFPKFYRSEDQSIIPNCKRFFTIADLFPKLSSNSKQKEIEHIMMERGEIGYYSVHKIDYGSLDCMLFLTEALLKIKKLPTCFESTDLRDEIVCKKLIKRNKGRIMFYPHSRVKSSIVDKNKISIFEKIKYILFKNF